MADTVTGQSLLTDWYDRYVRPKKEASLRGVFSSGTTPDFSLGRAPSTMPMGYRGPGIAAPAGLPASPTPSPAETVAPVVDPSAAPDPVVAPPAEATPSLTDRFNAGLDRVGEGLKDPVKMGLLTAGLSMMATPPRAVPYSNAEIIGQSGLHGLAFYEKALEDKRRQQALDVSAEEHKLTREDRRLAAVDRADYQRGILADKTERTKIETKKEASQSIIRAANAKYREAQTGKAEALNSEVPSEWADAMGHPEWAGMTFDQINRLSGPIVQNLKPEPTTPTAVVTDDKGNVTVVPKVPGTVVPGAGKTKTPPAGAKGGRPSALAERMAIAEKSWRQKNPGQEPTMEAIARHAQELWPPAAIQAAAAKKKTSSLRPGAAGAAPAPGYIPDPKKRTIGGKPAWISPDGKYVLPGL